MKINKIAVLEGDGIGPEVMKEALNVLDIISKKNNINFDCNKGLVGAAAIEVEGHPFPESTKNLCNNSDAILFGAIGDPKYDNNPKAKIRPEDGLLEMRKFLGLYANVRPVITYDSLLDSSPLKKEIVKGTNFVVYRELTGGIYFGEKYISKDRKSAYDTCSYSFKEIERISHLAFKEARKRKKELTQLSKELASPTVVKPSSDETDNENESFENSAEYQLSVPSTWSLSPSASVSDAVMT